MWVAPSARGLGVGRRILGALEQQAPTAASPRCGSRPTGRSRGQRAVPLGRLREVERFNDEPFAHHWFEKRLDEPLP